MLTFSSAANFVDPRMALSLGRDTVDRGSFLSSGVNDPYHGVNASPVEVSSVLENDTLDEISRAHIRHK